MSPPNQKKINVPAPALPDPEEDALRALLTVALDSDAERRYQAVDEFSDKFLLQPGSVRK